MEKQSIKKIVVTSVWSFIVVTATLGLLNIHDKNIMSTFFRDTAIAAVIFALLVALYILFKFRALRRKSPEQKQD